MGLSLVAFDTDHVKRYIFGTDKLKEIRGASSLLDYLNRIVMDQFAEQHNAQKVYANGGSGLFLVETERAKTFGKQVQQAYLDVTGAGSSVSFVSYPVPSHITTISDEDIKDTFDLLQWQLQEQKLHPPAVLVQPSHPFMRLCDACGVEYANAGRPVKKIVRDPGEEDEQYCANCQRKRARDNEVKEFIEDIESGRKFPSYDEYLWTTIIPRLREMEYDIPPQTERPSDFNVFRNFKGAKDYFALIYADVNNMGRAIEGSTSLVLRQVLAETVDGALYTSVCTAITRHLRITDHLKPEKQRTDDLKHPVFPFDILLLGGDDICMVVPASVAMDVALTLAETFRKETSDDRTTLSVSVVLAPIKYPFGILQNIAESALQFAKKKGADARAKAAKPEEVDDTRINFLVVTGSSSSNFKSVYEAVYHKEDEDNDLEFFATLRPYAPEDLHSLLKAIRDKDGANLGRTKLHQVREAVLAMNLTTSVSDGVSVLRNWRYKQRSHIVRNVYEFAGRYQMPRSNPDDPVSGFPRVTFPWFFDGKNEKNDYDTYRTSLLDFIELYDFLSREGGDNSDEG